VLARPWCRRTAALASRTGKAVVSSSDRQLDLVHAIAGDIAPRDAQDLMSWPFFSLAKGTRTAPINFRMGEVTIEVKATEDHGMATIWDADILIWAASQIVEARDAGRRTSRRIAAKPHELLRFIRRGTGGDHYARLRAALDRLQSTTIATSIRQGRQRRGHRFSWLNEWKERLDENGRPLGIEMILPDWLYDSILDQRLILTIDKSYFALTGGVERWLYRLVRKHGGRQVNGWSFDVEHLYLKSGSLGPLKRFAFNLRAIVEAQSLPGYTLSMTSVAGKDMLVFKPVPADPMEVAQRRVRFGKALKR
jgi:plasmid replication initiation protein